MKVIALAIDRAGSYLRSSARVSLLSLLLAAGVTSVVGSTLLDTRRDAWDRASNAARNLVQAVERDLSSDIKLIDLTLQAADEMRTQAGGLHQSSAFRRELLDEHIKSTRHLDTVLLLDEAGNAVFNSRRPLSGPSPNFSNRDYFTALRDNPNISLYVSQPYQSKLAGGLLSIGFSRRLSRPDGSFAGIALGVVRVEALKDLFEGIELGKRGSMTLLRDDGPVLMRSPFDERQIGRDLSNGPAYKQMIASPTGQFISVAAIDGVTRLYSHRRLEGVPLIVNVALSVEQIYAAWWRKAITVGAVTMVLTSTMVVMTFVLLRTLRRRQQAEQAAWQSEATFRLLAENSNDMVSRLDLDGTCLYVSPASEQIFGRSPEEMRHRGFLDDVFPEDVRSVRDAWSKLREENSVTVRYRIITSAGRVVWLEVTARAVKDSRSGKHECVVAVTRDISERKRLEQELAAAANEDSLTGLANRRSFDEVLEQEWLRARRDGTPLSLLLLDVDHFKLFNDSYGHVAGDDCLRKVAAAIAKVVRRPADLVARYGGEEMAVILPDTDPAGAAGMAEHVRAAVQAIGLVHAKNQPAGVVTVSVGVATVIPPIDDAVEPKALVATADGALYAAKHQGRNRVVSAKTVPPPFVAPPMPADEDIRLAALAVYEMAGVVKPGDEALTRITNLVAKLFGTPIALISLVGQECQIFAGRTGLDTESTAREVSFCAHLVASDDEALIVPDAAIDPRFTGNPLVTGSLAIRFYAGAPLICPTTGQRLGALCIIDYEARPALDHGQLLLLQDFAEMAVHAIAHRAAQTAA